MRRRTVSLTDYGPAPGRLDAAVEWLLGGLLVFLPFAFGGVEAWSELVAICTAFALAVVLVARRVMRPDVPRAWTWAYVPVALYLLLVVFQMLPLPRSLLGAISPGTVASRDRLLADLPQSGAGEAAVSFYALVTRHDLRVVLVAVAVFVAVVEVYRRPAQVRRLLLTVTCVGAAVAALALAQQAGGADKIYWVVPIPHPVADGGPFINHNHFAQFMNLSIGAALALLMVKLRELRLGADMPPSEVAAALAEPEARAVWAYGVVFVAGLVAVLLSMSRGGMFGTLAGLALVTAAMARQQQLRAQGWLVAVLALAGFGVLLYFGFDALYDRLAAVRNLHEAAGGRFGLVRGAIAVWQKFPAFGTGLGTHAYVFPAYDNTGTSQLAQYVENEYVQALEETGAVGLVLVLAFAVVIWTQCVRAVRARRPRVCVAAVGLGYGLAAVTVHSVSDFGQHVPAVAALSAVTCGLMVALARLARQAKAAEAAAAAEPIAPTRAAEPPETTVGEGAPGVGALAPQGDLTLPTPVPRVRPSRLRLAIPMTVAVLLGWALPGAYSAYTAAGEAAEATRAAGALGRDGWTGGSDEDYTHLLEHAGAAAEARPDDVESRYWLNVYRWRSLARERDPSTGELLLTQEALDHTGHIVEELHAARPLCPTYGPLVSLAGQLELFILDRPQGLEHIRAAYALAPNHPDVVFTAAMADADRGDWDGSVAKFGHCVELAPQMVGEVMDVYEKQFDRPDLAVKVGEKGNNPTTLLQLSQRLKEKGTHPEAAAAAWDAGVSMLERWCERPDAAPAVLVALAGIYRSVDKVDAAIALYRRALVLDYSQVDWRLELARTLAASGKPAEALREAQICLRLRPTMEAAKDLVGTLTMETPATRPAQVTSQPSERAETGSGSRRIASH